jgi:hypothetical protein
VSIVPVQGRRRGAWAAIDPSIIDPTIIDPTIAKQTIAKQTIAGRRSRGRRTALGHFDQLPLIALGRRGAGGVLIAQEPRRNAQRFNLDLDSQDFLLFHPKYFVRIFH